MTHVLSHRLESPSSLKARCFADSQGQLGRGIASPSQRLRKQLLMTEGFPIAFAFHFSPELSLLVQISVPGRITIGLVNYHLFGLKKQMNFR